MRSFLELLLCEKKHCSMFNWLYETVEKQQKRNQLSVRDWRTNGVGVQLQVSNLKLFKLDVPVIGYPRVCTPITWQIGARRTNQNMVTINCRISHIDSYTVYMATHLPINESSGPGSSLTQGTALCPFCVPHFTPTVPLSTQVYKWVPAN